MEWKEGKIKDLSVLSKAGAVCTINPLALVKVTSNGRKTAFSVLADGSVRFSTVKGAWYELKIVG